MLVFEHIRIPVHNLLRVPNDVEEVRAVSKREFSVRKKVPCVQFLFFIICDGKPINSAVLSDMMGLALEPDERDDEDSEDSESED